MKIMDVAVAGRGRLVETDRDWLAVGASSCGLLFSIGTLSVYTFGVFVRPLVAEFHWSRTGLFASLAILQYVLALSSPLWGILADRFGPRAILLPSIALLAALIASLAFLTPHLWHLYLIFTLIPLLAGGATPLGYSSALVQLFQRRLGLSLGLALTGVGFGALILPPVTQNLVEAFGWRGAYAVLGALTLVIGIPAALVAGRNVSRAGARSPGRQSDAILPLLRSRIFLTMCAVFLLLGMISVGTLSHLVPMMIDRGLAPRAAARMAAVAGLATLIGRGGIGWLLDRVPTALVIATISLLTAVSLLLLGYGSGGTLYLAAFLLGGAIGAEIDFIAFLTGRHFPPATFGRVYGYAFGVYMIGAGSGPLALAIAFDHAGGYGPALSIFAAFGLLAAGAALLIPRRGTPRRALLPA